MRTILKVLALVAALFTILHATRAEAATYTVCIRLPVTIDDELDVAGEIGTDGNWIARGIYVNHVTQPNGAAAAGFPKLADPASGCFSFTSSQTGTFQVGVFPVGSLAGANTLQVFSPAGQLSLFTANVFLSGTGGTLIWPAENSTLRLYAVFAYAIQGGFRGNYDSETLKVWQGAGFAPCMNVCDAECTEDDNTSHIAMCSGSTKLKFVMAHEYGHANLERTIGFDMTNDCSANGGGHNIRSGEYSSCAAMEGWAHFVAADIWNGTTHDAGNPGGFFNYPGAIDLINVESSQGGCATVGETVMNFRTRYADFCQCWITGNDCTGWGVELDWMRFWWDFHTNGSGSGSSGSPPNHNSLQAGIDASGGWGSEDVWTALRDAQTGAQLTRYNELGDANGNSEPD